MISSLDLPAWSSLGAAAASIVESVVTRALAACRAATGVPLWAESECRIRTGKARR